MSQQTQFKENLTFSTELLEEINVSIIKNLPEQVGNVLKELLIKGEEDAEELKRVCENYNKLNDKYLAQAKQLNEYIVEVKNINALTEKLVNFEKNIIERELKLDKTILEIKLEESEKRAVEAVSIVGMVFKSPVYKKNISETVFNTQQYDNNGKQHTVNNGGFISETSVEE